MSIARQCLSTLLLSAALAAPLASHADPRYTVTVVGGVDSYSTGINNLGAVVGSISIASTPSSRAFIGTGSSTVLLGTFGGAESYGANINDSGQVTGWADTSDGQRRAFLYSGGAMTNLGTLGGTFSYGRGINNGGVVVGYSGIIQSGEFGEVPRAFVRAPGGTMQDIGTLPFPDPVAYGVDINNVGQVVGMSGQGGLDFPTHAFLYSAGVMTDLGTFGGEPSGATALNDLGQVVGYAALPYGFHVEHAFLYSGGVLIDLDRRPGDVISSAFDINNLGQIVGASDNLGAFLYEGGAMQSLTAMLDPASGWRLLSANGINELGQIAATAVLGDHSYAVRLDPVPEPATICMLLAGLGLVGMRASRRRAPFYKSSAASPAAI